MSSDVHFCMSAGVSCIYEKRQDGVCGVLLFIGFVFFILTLVGVHRTFVTYLYEA